MPHSPAGVRIVLLHASWLVGGAGMVRVCVHVVTHAFRLTLSVRRQQQRQLRLNILVCSPSYSPHINCPYGRQITTRHKFSQHFVDIISHITHSLYRKMNDSHTVFDFENKSMDTAHISNAVCGTQWTVYSDRHRKKLFLPGCHFRVRGPTNRRVACFCTSTVHTPDENIPHFKRNFK